MKVAIGKQCGALIKDDALMQNSKKIYIVEFVFDQSWDGFEKTVVYSAGGVTISGALTDDRGIIPAKCLETAGVYLKIGVFGTKGEERKNTVWCLTSKILHKSDIGDIVPPSPTPSVPEEVQAQVVEVIRTQTASNDEIGGILDDIFGGEGEHDPAGGGSGNTATNEEIGSLLDDIFGS